MKAQLKKFFVAGLILFIPLVVTVYTLIFMFNFFDGILAPAVKRAFGTPIPGLGLLSTLLLILALGVFATNAIGKRLVDYLEGMMVKLPIVKVVYPVMKQASAAMLMMEETSFKKVVLVEYPRKGIYSIGFVTSGGVKEVEKRTAQKMLNVFVPTTPNPTSGMLVVVPEEEAIPVDLTVEDAVGFIVSGGFFRRT